MDKDKEDGTDHEYASLPSSSKDSDIQSPQVVDDSYNMCHS